MADSLPPSAPPPGDPPPDTPSSPAGSSRRKVVKLTVLGLSGLAVGAGTPLVLTRITARDRPRPWRFLSEGEARTLAAVCEQIVPADQDPGATEAGCVRFIDRQLVGHYQRFQAHYRKGLAALQATARTLHGKAFEELAWEQQTTLLKALEANKAPKELWGERLSATEAPQSPGDFFRMACAHTLQGFYGSPRHGGNRNYASYRMLGIEYPRVIGRSRGS